MEQRDLAGVVPRLAEMRKNNWRACVHGFEKKRALLGFP